ncbi:MAG: glycine cleavage system aminomethyltransferase GcvT [Zavarzinella sp.]
MELLTPLFDWHNAQKARMVPFGGWSMPVQYSSIIEEHQIVRQQAGLFDISHMGRIEFSGPDQITFLELVYTNAVSNLKVGQIRYGLVCNDVGGILDDVLVYRWAENQFSMVVNASNRTKILEHFHQIQQLHQLQVTWDDQTFNTAMIAIQGPKAIANSTGLFGIDAASLKYYYGAVGDYRGQHCLVSRTGYTGEDGLEVIVSKELATNLADDFVARGIKPCGLGARDTLRLEAAMPLYGHELNEETDPIQAGLGWAVKLQKADFIGKTAIQERATNHNIRKRVGLVLEGKRAAREGCIVLQNNHPAGIVTSGSYAPTLQQSIAMAYVDPQCSAVNTELVVDIRGTHVNARIVELPFYQRAS